MNIDETDRPERDTLELIHEEIRLTLARQADALTALNTRAQQMLAFGGAFIALIVGLPLAVFGRHWLRGRRAFREYQRDRA